MLRNMIKVFHHKVELPAKPTILVKCCLVISACVEHALGERQFVNIPYNKLFNVLLEMLN